MLKPLVHQTVISADIGNTQETVENTGTEAITPGPVVMEIEGKQTGESPVGLLVAGQKETVEFRRHRPRRRLAVARTERR